ncbi:MAG: DEAD/DEAH box helicase [Candidatus Woesearchaeota archaeon]
MNLFKDLKLSNQLQISIKNQGIETPTEIQAKSIPYIMEGKDVIGESATGSGKTLAFGCSINDNVKHGEGIQALVLTPTRELAEQVKSSLKNLSYHKHLNVIAVYGGVSINPQIHDLRSADVVVATPGRFLDHLERRTINTSRIKVLVLDEADRMLDMGFIDDVEKIIRSCPRQRQTLFFSATISTRIQDLSNRYMNNPIRVNAVKQVDPSKLKQVYYDIPRNGKLSLLIHLLQNEKSRLVMVFCNTRKTTDFVVKNLRANSINTTAIHGGLSQNKRSKTIQSFNDARTNVLVCTDVAARGLHIENVSHVYNYEIPKDPKDYVHRIGRTARAGEEGKVINILCDFDYDNFSRLQSEYREFNIERGQNPVLKKVMIIRNETFRKPFQRGQRGRRPQHNFGRRYN